MVKTAAAAAFDIRASTISEFAVGASRGLGVKRIGIEVERLPRQAGSEEELRLR